MMRLIIGLYAIPALFVTGASLLLRERVVVVLCGLLSFIATSAIFCALLRLARSKGQGLWPASAGAIACLALITSVVTIHWPLRAAYLLSRPSLDQVAEDVQAGRAFAGPAQVGLFTIHQAQLNNHGIVCLWVDMNPAGKAGFVKCRPNYVPANTWSVVSLDDHWQYIAED